MSRFEDMDRFLDWQQGTQQEAQAVYDAQVHVSRSSNNGLIDTTFEVFDDYYRTVIAPRANMRVVRKQQEYPELHPRHPLGWPKYGERVHYSYLASVIPAEQRDWPYQPTNQIDAWFAEPGRMTTFDWSPNVALQLAFELVTPYDEQTREYLPRLKPRVHLSVWGVVPQDSVNSDCPLPIGIGYTNSWYRDYSTLWLNPSVAAAPLLEPGLTEAFKLATPRVLAHRQFWGK